MVMKSPAQQRTYKNINYNYQPHCVPTVQLQLQYYNYFKNVINYN